MHRMLPCCKRFGWLSILVVLSACKGRPSGARASQVAAGLSHACALMENGRVECWGLDSRGQLGTRAAGSAGDAGNAGADSGALPPDGGAADAGADGGAPLPVARPAEIEGLEHVKAITAGPGFGCALVAGGEVRCWGENSFGQLGSSSVAVGGYSTAPVRVDVASGAVALASGMAHSCALSEGGSVACWGLDDAGQLGNPASPVQGAMAIAAGARHSCAVISAGVVCWGDNSVGQLGAPDGNAMPPFAGATDVAAGGNETCALRADGSVLCWGTLDPKCTGGCGLGPGEVPLTGAATRLAIGLVSACALLDSGSIECWDATGAVRAVKSVSSAKAMDVGAGFACAVLSDASAVCWGDNSTGQLGDGTTAAHTGLVPVQL